MVDKEVILDACVVGIVMEFCTRILTVLLPPSLKAVFYHSALVLFLAVMVGR